MYIGKAVNLKKRWENGRHGMEQYVRDPEEWLFNWWEIPEECIGLVEQALILKFRPLLNKRIY
jgi:excinuclease UvrABC nuclease subunit